jgi:hypothetical protein
VACDEGKGSPDNLNAAASNTATAARLVKGDEQAARIGLEKLTDLKYPRSLYPKA